MENRLKEAEGIGKGSQALEEKVSGFLRDCGDTASLVLLSAFSGGRDSTAMLSVLKDRQEKFGYVLKAIHIHHGLRLSADEDEAFCRSLCELWGIPLLVFHVDTPSYEKEKGYSTEEAARELRYQCLEEAAASCEEAGYTVKVALAHHRSDQAETVLLHLLRGSGIRGLGGMHARRGRYFRPMLDVSEEEIDAYVKAKKLVFRVDETNADTAYTRNRIRLELLPYLERAFNPRIVETLCALAETAAEDEDCLESLMPPVEKGTLDLTEWDKLDPAVRKRTLRAWLSENGLEKDVFKVHLDALEDLAEGPSGRRISLPQGLTVQKSYDILSIIDFLPEETESKSYRSEYLTPDSLWKQFPGPGEIPDREDEKWMSADALSEPIVWRKREPGDFLYAGGGRQKLKEFMIDRKIPRDERDRMTLLASGSHILWIPGYRISDAVKVTQATKTILHVWEARNV